MKKYEYKGKQWHEQCFCCKVCQQPISNKSFIPREQEVVCVPCYEDQYAQRCMKCNGVSYTYPALYQVQRYAACNKCRPVQCCMKCRGVSYTACNECRPVQCCMKCRGVSYTACNECIPDQRCMKCKDMLRYVTKVYLPVLYEVQWGELY